MPQSPSLFTSRFSVSLLEVRELKNSSRPRNTRGAKPLQGVSATCAEAVCPIRKDDVIIA
jgi:hypothetical protein